MSAQLWSETVRTDAQMDHMIYPRLFVVAERSWHRASWERDYQPGQEYTGGKTYLVDQQARLHDWQRFANLLGQRELAKLDKAGIDYRLPVPGAKIVDGILSMNVALPGVTLEYSLDKGVNWQRYDANRPPQVSGAVAIRSVSRDGQRTSRVEIL
ncbi:family 20 glycosylhydrolase [Pantoea sp. S62]|nr:family 20 glycosylhydrolase [Pantoea sp. S62]